MYDGRGCSRCDWRGTVRFDDYGHIPCQDCGHDNVIANTKLQPTPVVNDHPHIMNLVIADVIDIGPRNEEAGLFVKDIMARGEVGYAKYGTYLQPHNGRDALIDMYQELVDAVKYMRALLYENFEQSMYDQYNTLVNIAISTRRRILDRDGK